MARKDSRSKLGGRKSSVAEAKALLALWSALSSDGATVDASIVSQRLGVDEGTAQRLLDLLVSARGRDADYLPLFTEDGDTSKSVSLLSMGKGGSPALRLTSAESAALTAALDTLGVSLDDPLRAKLSELAAVSSEKAEEDGIRRRLAAAYASSCGDVLLTCSKALANGNDLDFLYQGTGDATAHERHVSPIRIRHSGLLWYLDAYDHGRGAQRTFRADRMVSPRPSVHRRQQPPSNEARQDAPRLVRLTFHDRECLTGLDWPGLEAVQESDGITTAQIPYYESSSTWLVRRLASAGGRVTTDDSVLRANVESYARRLLAESAPGRP